MGFPTVPTELQLYGMEECIICPRLLFFQMKTHFMGGHTRVVSNVVNIPVDVAPTVETLPRSLSDTETIVVKYKRKLEYKNGNFEKISALMLYGEQLIIYLKIVIYTKMKILNLILTGSTACLRTAVHL